MLYEKLPYDIAERHVLLMDPILASGNTCAAAIEVPRHVPRCATVCHGGIPKGWEKWEQNHGKNQLFS